MCHFTSLKLLFSGCTCNYYHSLAPPMQKARERVWGTVQTRCASVRKFHSKNRITGFWAWHRKNATRAPQVAWQHTYRYLRMCAGQLQRSQLVVKMYIPHHTILRYYDNIYLDVHSWPDLVSQATPSNPEGKEGLVTLCTTTCASGMLLLHAVA